MITSNADFSFVGIFFYYISYLSLSSHQKYLLQKNIHACAGEVKVKIGFTFGSQLSPKQAGRMPLTIHYTQLHATIASLSHNSLLFCLSTQARTAFFASVETSKKLISHEIFRITSQYTSCYYFFTKEKKQPEESKDPFLFIFLPCCVKKNCSPCESSLIICFRSFHSIFYSSFPSDLICMVVQNTYLVFSLFYGGVVKGDSFRLYFRCIIKKVTCEQLEAYRPGRCF